MQPELINGILYDTENGYEYTVTSCEDGVENAVISLTVLGNPVVGIACNAFENRKALKSVTFTDYPDEYVDFSVEEYAFSGCSSLVEISLPHSCVLVGTGAFHSCTSLQMVTLPSCHVSAYAFYNCESLTEITPLGNIAEGVFSHCKSLTAPPISDGVEEIDEDAFRHCYSLTDITIPKSVKRIAALAFRSCYGLKSVVFEDSKGWYSRNMYTSGEVSIDVTDAKENAASLAEMDYDDGIIEWYKK